MSASILPVAVVTLKADSKGKLTSSNVVIRAAGQTLAFANLGGKYSPEQGLKEFRKGNPKFNFVVKSGPITKAVLALA